MGACDFEYELITPDGWTLNFVGPRFSWGTADSLMAHEGFGLPPVEHVTQEVYGTPGALLRDVNVKPRVVTITTTTHGLTRWQLHQARAKLNDAMRWNRGEPNEPSILRYTVKGVSRDLYVHYAGDVTRSVGRYGDVEVVGFRLVAYDPMFYDPATREQVLEWGLELSIRLVARKAGGEWDAMGPPAGVANGAGGKCAISAITISPDGRYVYFGGDFTNFDNIPAADHIVRWDTENKVWQAVGGGVNNVVRAIHFLPDGTLYIGGFFTNGTGGAGDPLADYIARHDPVTDTWVNVGGGPGAGVVTMVNAVLMGKDGKLYVGGEFTNWAGIGAADHIVSWTATGDWASLGADALDGAVYDMCLLQNGHIVAGGWFSHIGVAAYAYVAEWDPNAGTWAALGSGFDSWVTTLTVGLDGTLYAGGYFENSGPVECVHVAQWNGFFWSAMGDGLGDVVGPMTYVVKMFTHPTTGHIYATGIFFDAGGVFTADHMAKWNGSAWLPVDVVIPLPVAYAPRFAFSGTGDLYLGLDYQGTLSVVGSNSIQNAGNTLSYPVFEIKNAGTIKTIINETTGRELLFDMQMLDGEIVTIDLSPGAKTVQSTWLGNRLGDVLPSSDLGAFCLESHPRADHGGVQGANLLAVLLTGADPREKGDNNNQLSGWRGITGISQDNTDHGKLYVSIINLGGGNRLVNLFKAEPRNAANLVGHTASYNGIGPQAIIEDNDSGLGGQITIDAIGPAAHDLDIEVVYTFVTIFWRNAWLDADSAVTSRR